ncbi:MAG: Uma2 family endonuclease [Planctomycetes bacterium]|nr:Uma2 family endonuclease [Planctomycetota bacterium]
MATQVLKPKKTSGLRESHGGNHRPRGVEVVINGNVRIPAWVMNQDSFRRWAFSNAFPQRGRYSWLDGNLWVEVYSDLLEALSDADAKDLRRQASAPLQHADFPSLGNGAADSAHGTEIMIDGIIRVPRTIQDIESFQRWALSSDFPGRGRFSFLNDQLWVDLSMETLIHNLIKGQIGAVLTMLVALESLGEYLHDGMLFINRMAGISNEPDGAFMSNKSVETGRVKLEEGIASRTIEGSLDMALEVVSKTSIEKDSVILKELYAKAGVAEYWLVDSTVEDPELVIMRLMGGKYVTVRKHDGWVKSHVFGRSFRLSSKAAANGLTKFTLETK